MKRIQLAGHIVDEVRRSAQQQRELYCTGRNPARRRAQIGANTVDGFNKFMSAQNLHERMSANLVMEHVHLSGPYCEAWRTAPDRITFHWSQPCQMAYSSGRYNPYMNVY